MIVDDLHRGLTSQDESGEDCHVKIVAIRSSIFSAIIPSLHFVLILTLLDLFFISLFLPFIYAIRDLFLSYIQGTGYWRLRTALSLSG